MFIEHKDVKRWAVLKAMLALLRILGIGPQWQIFERGAVRIGGQGVMALHHVLLVARVAVIDNAAWEPVRCHLVIISLAVLGHIGIERAAVFIRHIIAVISPEFCQCLVHFGVPRHCQISPRLRWSSLTSAAIGWSA